MKLFNLLFVGIIALLAVSSISAQIDSGTKYITVSNAQSYYGGNPLFAGNTNGDGRFLVFVSNGNIATYNPRNADGNPEIFLMDYAQRHIFQITDTKSKLVNPSGSSTASGNISIYVTNTAADISNDGQWIVFSSNATSSIPSAPDNNSNPGNFDGNGASASQSLPTDGNLEIWLYHIPAFQPADLTSGDVPQFVNLSAGTFTQITNSLPSRIPVAGTSTQLPNIASDNVQASIDDNGETIVFVSNRDYTGFNSSPENNDEIFTYKRSYNTLSQITRTPRSSIGHSIYQTAPTVSGNGSRIVFDSNATNPIPGMNGGTNSDFSHEVYMAEIDASGGTTGFSRQVTDSTINTFEAYTNLPIATRNISRDGQFILLQSRAKLDTDNTSANTSATFVFDCSGLCQVAPGKFRQIGPRFDADPVLGNTAGGGTSEMTFTDYDNNLAPHKIVFESRMNFRPDGTVLSSGSSEGLNPSAARPPQIFAYSLTDAVPSFTRLTNTQNIDWGIGTRVIPSNKKERINFITLDSNNWNYVKFFHLLTPNITQEDSNASLSFYTGASKIAVSSGQGLMPGMLGSVVYSSQLTSSITGFATNVSNNRNFVAPLQLKGVSLTVDGIRAAITGVTNGQINFVVPSDVAPGNRPFVINHNGIILRGTIPISASPQPDIVTNQTNTNPAPGGRARILNVTNPNDFLSEPFAVNTQTPNGSVPTILRLFATGIEGIGAGSISIRIGTVDISPSLILTGATVTDYPGVFSIDFTLPQELSGAGDLPITITVVNNGQSFTSRPAATAPRLQISINQVYPNDLAVWRPGNGVWYILGAQQQITYFQWGGGSENDIPLTVDFDGDAKIDFCVFRPSNGVWYIVQSSDNQQRYQQWGQSGDIPVPADYDGDGKADIAFWRPSTGIWYILQSSNGNWYGAPYGGQQFGDVPTPGDFDGDRKADIAVWRSTAATFYALKSSDNQPVQYSVGQAGDKPVLGDYDGDGKIDAATRHSDGVWSIRYSSNGVIHDVLWGFGDDIPVQGLYDADVKTDIAVWRPSTGAWYIQNSADGSFRGVYWGQNGDTPVPGSYRRP